MARQSVPDVRAEREAKRKAEEEARRKAEEEARRKAEEARRAAEEAARQQAEEQARQAAAAAAAAAQPQAAAPAPAPAPAPAQAAPSQPRTSAPTRDYGIAASTYTGAYYNAGYENTRKCIVRKESGGNYGIVSSNGLYHGAYQFSRSTGDATARMMGRGDLVGTPVSSWSRYDQDTAFWTLWNNGAGRGHWPTAAGC